MHCYTVSGAGLLEPGYVVAVLCLPTFNLFIGNRALGLTNISGRLISAPADTVCTLLEMSVAYERAEERHTRALSAWVTASHNIGPRTSSHPGHINET